MDSYRCFALSPSPCLALQAYRHCHRFVGLAAVRCSAADSLRFRGCPCRGWSKGCSCWAVFKRCRGSDQPAGDAIGCARRCKCVWCCSPACAVNLVCCFCCVRCAVRRRRRREKPALGLKACLLLLRVGYYRHRCDKLLGSQAIKRPFACSFKPRRRQMAAYTQRRSLSLPSPSQRSSASA